MQRREAGLRLGAHERAVLEQQRAHLLVPLLGRHMQRRLAVLCNVRAHTNTSTSTMRLEHMYEYR